MSTWNEQNKARAVELYESMNPTAETTLECVKQVAESLAEEFNSAFTANGTRMILQKAGVYIAGAKAAAASTPKAAAASTGGGRISKDAAIGELRAAISDMGGDVDEEIIGKLTGKAALYFTTIIRKAG